MRLARSSVRAIACALGRSPGTISRELARNVGSDGSYAALPAQALRQKRRVEARAAPKLHPNHVLWSIVLSMLDWKWSPQQIAGILKRVWPQDPTMRVSQEPIYTAIYVHPRGELRR